MLDSGASHNLMPKVIMEQLQLDITRPYHDLYTFDSKKVPCLGLIKDLVVTISKIPVKSVVLNIVFTDIPPKFGMLLSRSRCANRGGSLQMDMSYPTIPVYGAEHISFYREVIFMNTFFRVDQVRNHPIYVDDHDFGCFTLSSENLQNTQLNIEKITDTPLEIKNDFYKLYFDGAFSKERVGADIILISPSKENITQSYKLEFDVTNNVECEDWS